MSSLKARAGAPRTSLSDVLGGNSGGQAGSSSAQPRRAGQARMQRPLAHQSGFGGEPGVGVEA